MLVSAAGAIGLHAWLLFGARVGTPAVPLPVADTAVEVSLVEAAPAAIEPDAPSPEPPAPPPREEPAAEPEPAPMIQPPEPEPEPAPTEPEPEPPPAPVPKKAAPPPRRVESSPAVKPAPPRRPSASRGRPSPQTGAGDSSAKATSAQPRYRSNPKPEYPREARRLKQQGRVLIDVEVSASGRPASVTLKRSSGVPSLDEAALTAVRRWTFDPARAGGIAISSRVEVPVQFNLAQ